MSVAVIACGALAWHVRSIAERRGWDVTIVPLPPELHNHPDRIEGAVAEAASRYDRVVVAYAECGTGTRLDRWSRLEGSHCYDIFARDEVRRALSEQPGTYFLTDFLVRAFDRVVWRGLGLDRHPELRDAYFRHYTRVVWLAQRPTEKLRTAAAQAAGKLELPLEICECGDEGLEEALGRLVTTATALS